MSLKSNPDNSRTAAAPTQQIGRNFENSQLFVSTVSIKASQNSTSKNCLDLNTRKIASETKMFANVLQSEEAGLKSEKSLLEDSKLEVGEWQEHKFLTPSPKLLDRKTLKPSTPLKPPFAPPPQFQIKKVPRGVLWEVPRGPHERFPTNS